MECSVCLGTYSLSDRLPKVLPCQHTICGQCVDQLRQGYTIKCPTCRQQCAVGEVTVNIALTDVLQALCPLCLVRGQKLQCSHCQKKLCDECHETHRENIHKELVSELIKLEQVVLQATDVSNDDRILDQEHAKDDATISEIKQAINYHRDALNKLEKDLKMKVRSAAQRKYEVLMAYKSSLNEKITKGKGFQENTAELINGKHSSVAEMTTLLAKCQDLVEELAQLTKNFPALEDYRFIRTAGDFNPLSVGNLVTEQNSRISQLPSRASIHSGPDYKTLRYHSHTGSKGSDPTQFNGPHSVVCTSDQVIVSDMNNNRVKFYDNDLNLLFVVGKKTSPSRRGKWHFSCPIGLAVGPGGEVYVCDSGNHRIVVLSPQGKHIRYFGTQGSGAEGLNHPSSMAIIDDCVYIVDTFNYRIKVVKTDGTFIRDIGSGGTNPGRYKEKPRRIAVTSPRNGRVLVKEDSNQQLHVHSRMGEYQGLFPPNIPTQLATAKPIDVTVDTADNIIIAYDTNQLAVYDSRGGFITVIGSYGSQPGYLRFPSEVSVNTQRGHLVVCDWLNNRIQMFKFE